MAASKPRFIVTDTQTGRTGEAIQRAGYLMNGSYVNPYWEVLWTHEDEEEE